MKKDKKTVYGIITERFIEALERGRIPWAKPWSTSGLMPANGLSGRRYSGVNTLILGMMPYEQPYWLTYNQAKKAGGNVKKGEKSTPVVYWMFLYFDKESGKKLSKKEGEKRAREDVRIVPYPRYYNVFNIDQCENLDEAKIQRAEVKTHEWDADGAAEKIVAGMPDAPKIDHNGGGRAFYRPATDHISMPERERFKSAAGYYSTLFHEMAHSTGHSSRLNRDLTSGAMCKKSYSREELIAEISSAFLNAEAGYLDQEFDNSAAYVNGWLSVFRNEDNERLIITAAAQAQKAADYILNRD